MRHRIRSEGNCLAAAVWPLLLAIHRIYPNPLIYIYSSLPYKPYPGTIDICTGHSLDCWWKSTFRERRPVVTEFTDVRRVYKPWITLQHSNILDNTLANRMLATSTFEYCLEEMFHWERSISDWAEFQAVWHAHLDDAMLHCLVLYK